MLEPEREQSQTPTGDAVKPTLQGAEGEATPEKTEPKPEDSPGAGEPDYKKKFSESTSENQRIREENAQLLQEKQELENKLVKASETPSEKELSEKYPDWEYKDDAEKSRLTQEEAREKRLRRIEENLAWEDDFKSLVRQSDFSSLKEREDEFKDFAYKYPKSVDLKTLAKSFLYDSKPAEAPEVVPQRQGLETPSGGPSEVQAPGMTLEDITRLRVENPKLYLKMVQEGKLKTIPEK